MKKTQKTMFTAALLSAAVALQSETLVTQSQASAPVYGPPPADTAKYLGDIDKDGENTLVDYILLKSIIIDREAMNREVGDEDTLDLNADGIVDENDLKVFERYIFGKIPDVQNVYPEDRDDRPSIAEEPAVTKPSSEWVQTKYGPFPAVTTAIGEEIMQPDYGVIPVDPIFSETMMPEPIIPVVYGPPPSYTEEIPEETEPAVTTVQEEPPAVFPTDEIPQCVYGPPSWFE